MASERYPALDLDGILIFIGVLFFLTLGLAMWLERRALRHMEVEALKRIYYGLIPLPWLLAVPAAGQRARIVSSDHRSRARGGKFAMRGPAASRRLVVTSWRAGHRVERIPVDRGDFDRFSYGDLLEVKVAGGLVGIPWVEGVSRP